MAREATNEQSPISVCRGRGEDKYHTPYHPLRDATPPTTPFGMPHPLPPPSGCHTPYHPPSGCHTPYHPPSGCHTPYHPLRDATPPITGTTPTCLTVMLETTLMIFGSSQMSSGRTQPSRCVFCFSASAGRPSGSVTGGMGLTD